MNIKTSEKIIDIAQEMVQTRGYHGFSYRDISERIGIKTASIHYHYPAKSDLAKALLERGLDAFDKDLEAIDAEGGHVKVRLQKFTQIFLKTYGDDGRLCPFCMIATSQNTISGEVQAEVSAFWMKGEAWLENLLESGERTGELELKGSAQLLSRVLLSSLEGAMIVAKSFDDRDRLEASIGFILSLIIEKGG